LYKQATEGDIPGIASRPGVEEDEPARAKWYVTQEVKVVNIVGMPGILNEGYRKQKLKDVISQV